MQKITLQVDGMQCGMCEVHVNDAVRGAFPVKKVTSSHAKGETVILAEAPLDEAKLQAAIEATGYTVGGIRTEEYQKAGLFARLFGKKD